MAIHRPEVLTPWADGAPDNAQPPGPLLSSGFPETTPRFKPEREEFNWLLNYCMNGLRYLCLRGAAEWSADESYSVGDIVRDAGGTLYQLTQAAVAGTLVSNAAYWRMVFSSPVFGLSNLAAPAHVFRDAARRQIAGFDHLGMPTGRIFVIADPWDRSAITTKNAPGSGTLYGEWRYGIFGDDGIIKGLLNGTSADRDKYPTGMMVALGLDNATNPSAAVLEWRPDAPQFYFKKETVVFEWDFSNVDGTLGFPASNMSLAVGFGDGSLVAGGSFNTIEATGFPIGAGVYKKAGQNNWFSYVKPSGSAVVDHDTTIGSIDDVVHHLRVEVVGEDADAENGTGRVSVYLDGVLQQTTTVDMEGQSLCPFARVSFAGPNDERLLCLGRPKTTIRDASGSVLY